MSCMCIITMLFSISNTVAYSQDFEVGAQVNLPPPLPSPPLKWGSGVIPPKKMLSFYRAVGEF